LSTIPKFLDPGVTRVFNVAYEVNRPFSAGNGPKAVFTREDRMKMAGIDVSDLGRTNIFNSAGQYNVESPCFGRT
jgi:hypothetical protein